MKIEVCRTAGEVARRGAALVAAALARNPCEVMALPTGRTPVAMYAELAAKRKAGSVDFSCATVFNLDEVLLPNPDPHTFFQFMRRHVWEPLGVAAERRFIPDGGAHDPLAECVRYEASIERAGGLGIAVLGVGSDGHIAYNLPGQIASRTHVVTLDPATVATLGRSIKGEVRAITMGIETIREARSLVLLATGSSKAEALRRLRDHPRSEDWPCTFFRDHADLLVVADAAAAAQL